MNEYTPGRGDEKPEEPSDEKHSPSSEGWSESSEGEREEEGGPTREARSSGQRFSKRVREEAGEAFERMRQRAGEATQERRDVAADRLESIGETLRNTFDDFRVPIVSAVTEHLADRLDQLSDYVRTGDVNDVMDRVEDWARRNPGVFIVGSFVGGFVLARYLKGSQRSQGFGERFRSSARSYGGPHGYVSRGPQAGERAGAPPTSASQYGGATSPSPTPGMTEPGGDWEEP